MDFMHYRLYQGYSVDFDRDKWATKYSEMSAKGHHNMLYLGLAHYTNGA